LCSTPAIWSISATTRVAGTISSPLRRPAAHGATLPTLGNHEEEAAQYFDVFLLPGEERWYSFDYGDAHFISLKADGYGAEGCFPDETQLAWLEGQLAANDRPWLFVFFHIGAFTSRDEGILELGMRQRLVPLFERLRRRCGLLRSQPQLRAPSRQRGDLFTIAGGGAPLYDYNQPEPGSQVVQPAHHYLLVDISGEQLTGRAIDPGGEIIDRFTLLCGK